MLRFAPPSAYLVVLEQVRAVFDGAGAKEGFELVRALSGFTPGTRAAAQLARDKGAAEESGRPLQNFAGAMG